MKIIFRIIVIIYFMSPTFLAANYCGELKGSHYGPFDYTDRHNLEYQINIVEIAHFTKDIENLVKGNTGSIAADLSYTLHAFPNHHRALSAMARLSIRDKMLKPTGAKYSIGCFFDRAIRFKPDDGTVRAIYGGYLTTVGKTDQAIKQFNVTITLQPENTTAHYNLGLLYMKKKNYKQARHHAKEAYALDFPLPGLKNQLIKAGQWEN